MSQKSNLAAEPLSRIYFQASLFTRLKEFSIPIGEEFLQITMAATQEKTKTQKRKMTMKVVQKSLKSRQEDKPAKSKKQMEEKVSGPMSKSGESKSEESESGVESISSASENEEDLSEEEEGLVDSEDDEDEDDIPVPQKKQKVSKREETEKFSNAMNALLDTHLKAYDRKDPILARSKKELKTFENEKLEEKAKRMLLAEKKKRLTANRIKDLLPTDDSKAREVLEKEKKLKKIAQKGVIKLFNAILMTQTATEQDISRESGIGSNKRKELVNEISKEKFLSLVQQAGK